MDTKNIIIEAFRMLLQKKPFNKITVQEILDEAKVSRNTFYRHFKDKYEIMNYYYKNKTDTIIYNPSLTYEEKIKSVMDFIIEYGNYFKEAVNVEDTNSFKNFIFSCSKHFYTYCYLSKNTDKDVSSIPLKIDFLTDFFAGGSVAIINKWLISKQNISSNELTESILKITPDDFC